VVVIRFVYRKLGSDSVISKMKARVMAVVIAVLGTVGTGYLLYSGALYLVYSGALISVFPFLDMDETKFYKFASLISLGLSANK
jgi:hypothetical protein